jgi:hypothetical protein
MARIKIFKKNSRLNSCIVHAAMLGTLYSGFQKQQKPAKKPAFEVALSLRNMVAIHPE